MLIDALEKEDKKKVISSRPVGGWLHLFVALGFVWGASFSFIETALTMTTPAGSTFWRTFLGAVALVLYLVWTRSVPERKQITWVFLWRVGFVGLMLSVIPALLFAFAQERVTTIVSSILNSATPIATAIVILLAFRDELPSRRQVAGVFVGLMGALVALGVRPGNLGENDPVAVAALVGAIACYGVGIPFSHKYVIPLGVPAKTMATFQISIAAVVLAPLYFLQSEPLFRAVPDVWSLTQILILGCVGTGFAYIWNFELIDRAGSTIASSVSYASLVVSLIIGWALLGEPFSWNLPIGALLVVVGSAIMQSPQAHERVRS